MDEVTASRLDQAICFLHSPLCEENEEQLLHRNVQRFRGGLVHKAHKFLYHSTLGLIVMKKKKKQKGRARFRRDKQALSTGVPHLQENAPP